MLRCVTQRTGEREENGRDGFKNSMGKSDPINPYDVFLPILALQNEWLWPMAEVGCF